MMSIFIFSILNAINAGMYVFAAVLLFLHFFGKRIYFWLAGVIDRFLENRRPPQPEKVDSRVEESTAARIDRIKAELKEMKRHQ